LYSVSDEEHPQQPQHFCEFGAFHKYLDLLKFYIGWAKKLDHFQKFASPVYDDVER